MLYFASDHILIYIAQCLVEISPAHLPSMPEVLEPYHTIPYHTVPYRTILHYPAGGPVRAADMSRELARPQAWYGTVWYGMVWYGMVWYDMVWNGMVWYSTLWYGMVRYGILWFGMLW